MKAEFGVSVTIDIDISSLNTILDFEHMGSHLSDLIAHNAEQLRDGDRMVVVIRATKTVPNHLPKEVTT